MAGIRPQARVSGFTGVHIALVVFVVLWLISTIGLVILYTGQSQLESERRAAVEERERLANQIEMTRFQALANKPGQTVLGRLAEERAGMAKAVTGAEDEDLATVQQRIQNLYRGIDQAGQIANAGAFKPDSMPLLTAAQTLYTLAADLTQRLDRTQAELAATKQQVVQLTTARDEQRAQFEQTVAGVQQQLEATQAQLDQFRQQQDQMVQGLRQQLTQRSDQMDRLVSEHRSELAQREENLTKMRGRLEEALTALRQMRGTPDVLAAAREADGQIVRALPNDQYVYINLGARDHVVLGMTFSVYSPGEGIPASGEGKATVEVTTVYDDVSAARVVRREGNQPILEGDLIANAVYSKDRKYKFLIVGGFDLDNNGVVDPDGQERIASLIREWGGQVVDELDTTTDFVVRGQGPTEPVAPAATASPIDKQRYQERLGAWRQYQATVEEAQDLMLPMLNQTQFLHFVGHNLESLRTAQLR